MKNVIDIIRMAEMGLDLAGDTATEWYNVARDSHLEAWELHTGREANKADKQLLFAVSALASYNASPAAQSRLFAEWLALDSTDGFLPNTSIGFEHFARHGVLGTSKAEAYRLAMMNGSGSDSVVLDRHMLRALSSDHAKPLTYSSKPVGAHPVYNMATRRVIQAGKALGLSGCQCQAAIWYAQVYATTGKVYGTDGEIDVVRHLRELEVSAC